MPLPKGQVFRLQVRNDKLPRVRGNLVTPESSLSIPTKSKVITPKSQLQVFGHQSEIPPKLPRHSNLDSGKVNSLSAPAFSACKATKARASQPRAEALIAEPDFSTRNSKPPASWQHGSDLATRAKFRPLNPTALPSLAGESGVAGWAQEQALSSECSDSSDSEGSITSESNICSELKLNPDQCEEPVPPHGSDEAERLKCIFLTKSTGQRASVVPHAFTSRGRFRKHFKHLGAGLEDPFRFHPTSYSSRNQAWVRRVTLDGCQIDVRTAESALPSSESEIIGVSFTRSSGHPPRYGFEGMYERSVIAGRAWAHIRNKEKVFWIGISRSRLSSRMALFKDHYTPDVAHPPKIGELISILNAASPGRRMFCLL